MSAPVTITPLSGIPEVREGDDLVTVIGLGLTASGLRLADGDVLVVSSKIASKALGLVTHDPDKDRVVAGETEYVVAERSVGDRITRIVRAKAGPIMAAAGVDGSNTGRRGGWLLLPHDPDAVCAHVHDAILERHGVRVGVVLSDTAGRAWRVGQVDFALGAHGVRVVDDLRGGTDADGRPLEVTTRALADEIASAADLAKGKAEAVPAALVRGLGRFVLTAGDEPLEAHPRGRDLVRTGPGDWFGYGRVEAVRASLGIEPGSEVAERVGIAPVHGDSRLEAVARATQAALHGVESGTADIGHVSVTLGADGPYELGILTARLCSALWCEWLVGEPQTPAADGLSVVVGVSGRLDGH
ncbi:F420-dependent oxidoreductase [Intrasporangium oryzae NRRL B-24470]|uniref:F420-dependent oxidoreductase n=1 Tax=Intrasporangium oryzae NRRL B-24470 TaxID=1386089 RepID=W9G6P5_9MICO|nr:coenzyme F420-0:L-glutamate ligase [Intrasporangium oryzae]EWT00483.1 F420-dependent oxidoreductase [Intrasporangium oryzae NRRL B-24470]